MSQRYISQGWKKPTFWRWLGWVLGFISKKTIKTYGWVL